MPTAFIFDMDGVLIDSRRAVEEAYRLAGMTKVGRWGQPWHKWLIDAAGSHENAVEIHERKNELYPSLLDKFATELPLATLVRTLWADNRPVFIMTSASHPAADVALGFVNLPNDILIGTGLTVEQKESTLHDLSRQYPTGIYFDDHSNVSVPDGWGRVTVA